MRGRVRSHRLQRFIDDPDLETRRVLAETIVRSLGGVGRLRRISASVDDAVWERVRELVEEDGAAESLSAAVEEALALWIGEQGLRAYLAEELREHPDWRPTPEEIAETRRGLGI